MISSDGIRGYNDAIILTILAEGDSYGYAISKEIRERTDEIYVIKETTLYSAFTRLGKLGAAGKSALTEKIAEWEQTKKVVDRFLIGS